MQTLVVIIYLFVVLAMVAAILSQRSEGGGLGSGGNNNGFMSRRGSGNSLSRLTAILATLFFALAIVHLVMGTVRQNESSLNNLLPENNSSVLEQVGGAPEASMDHIPQVDEHKKAEVEKKNPEKAPEKTTEGTPAVPKAL